jgi:hypothetical protein
MLIYCTYIGIYLGHNLAKILLPTKISKCPVNYYLYLKVDTDSYSSSSTGVEWKESNTKVMSSSTTGSFSKILFLTHVHALCICNIRRFALKRGFLS